MIFSLLYDILALSNWIDEVMQIRICRTKSTRTLIEREILSMKKTFKSDVVIVILPVLSIVLVIFLKEMFSKLCVEKNSPFLILLDTFFNRTGILILCFAVIFLVYHLKFIREWKTDRKDDVGHHFSGKLVIIILAVLFILNLFPLSEEYGYLQINNKEPSSIQYRYYLLSDAIRNETETMNMNPENFYLECRHYTVGGGRGSIPYTYTVYYASFNNYRVRLYNRAVENYIYTCRKYKRDIEVEYYKKSGIIKTVDGITLYDKSAFDMAVYNIEQEEAEKQAIEDAIKAEEERKELDLFTAFFYGEGENYEKIVKKLESEGIKNTYDIKYISTQYFEVGTIALFDNTQNVVYVVRDNDKEEMIEVPSLPYNGTFEEITQILDNSGIKWTFDCMGSYSRNEDELDHSKDILNTVHCSPGTPIPKDYVFWFSVRHAD